MICKCADEQMSRCCVKSSAHSHICTSAHLRIIASGLCASDSRGRCVPTYLLHMYGLCDPWPNDRDHVRSGRHCMSSRLQSKPLLHRVVVPGHNIHRLVHRKHNILLHMTSGIEMIPRQRSALVLLKFSSVFVFYRY